MDNLDYTPLDKKISLGWRSWMVIGLLTLVWLLVLGYAGSESETDNQSLSAIAQIMLFAGMGAFIAWTFRRDKNRIDRFAAFAQRNGFNFRNNLNQPPPQLKMLHDGRKNSAFYEEFAITGQYHGRNFEVSLVLITRKNFGLEKGGVGCYGLIATPLTQSHPDLLKLRDQANELLGGDVEFEIYDNTLYIGHRHGIDGSSIGMKRIFKFIQDFDAAAPTIA